MQDLHVLLTERSTRGALPLLAEELAQLEVEDREDLEEVVEGDPVFALFHAGQIGLLNANLARQLGLSEMPLLAQSTQTTTDRGHLRETLLSFLGHLGCRFLSRRRHTIHSTWAQFTQTIMMICGYDKKVKAGKGAAGRVVAGVTPDK
jgi:hypothetical protein